MLCSTFKGTVTGLTMKAFAQGYKAVFTPGATVYHFISASRITPEYFERRAYYQVFAIPIRASVERDE